MIQFCYQWSLHGFVITMHNVILTSFSFMKYAWSKQECKVCILYLVSLHCDVCGYCTPIDPDSFPEVSDKYSVPDLAPRIRGLSNHRSRRYTVGQQTSKRMVCLEICVRWIIVCTNSSMQVEYVIFSNNFKFNLNTVVCCNSKISIFFSFTILNIYIKYFTHFFSVVT